jgi:protein ImuA
MKQASLADIKGLWRGGRPAVESTPGISTGFPPLDRELPGGGWPSTALVELHCDTAGVGEVRFLLPAMRALTGAGGTVVLFTSPALARLPVVPYAPSLSGEGIDLARLLVIQPETEKEMLWALEQVLRAGAGSGIGACVAWPTNASFPALRRLQLAAESGGVPAFLFRPEAQVSQSSPAPLRLQLYAEDRNLAVRILKRRGAWLDQPILLPLPDPGAVDLAALHEFDPVPVDRVAPAAPLPRPDRATATVA